MRWKSPVLLALMGCALTLVLSSHSNAQGAKETASDDEADRTRIGYSVAPVRLFVRHKDPDLVGLGSYLVNVQAGCNDCHTNPSYLPAGDPFNGKPIQVNAAGYLAGGQSFGPFVSRNITPDSEGKPAGLTFAAFTTVMRKGIDPDHLHPQLGPLLQVMPWPTYSHMTDHDLYAIYEYLSSIPSLPDSAGAS